MKSLKLLASEKMLRILGLSLFVSISALSAEEGDPFYYNKLSAPRGAQDLLKIQNALQEGIARVRPATVAIRMDNGAGSGVIVSADGLVLTAAHVSGGVDKSMTVIMEDGTEYEAISLGLDSETDAAMIQIQGEVDLPYVQLATGSRNQLGDWVFVVAHPGGYDQDRGSVVRLGRMIRQQKTTSQSDCALIGGDSGGPLFNMKGELIGINSRVGKTVEESLHVPLPVFEQNWERLKSGEFIGEGPFAEKPSKGSGVLGVQLAEGDGASGALVDQVMENSAASEAGVKDGDLLTAVNGDEVKSREELIGFMKEITPGEIVTLSVLRGDEELELKVKVRPR